MITHLDIPAHSTVSLDTPFPILVCDPIHFVQVFQNLIGNAVRYQDKPQTVIDDVTRHIGDQKVYDDVTLVVLKQC